MSARLLVCDLGTMPYAAALELQRGVARSRITKAVDEDVLLLVEHPPVVTMGRSSKQHHLLATPALLAKRGVELFEVERGGDVTFHGPGQLVGYPIIDLKRHKQDLHWYLRQVEEALIRALAPFGIEGERNVGFTGVWTNGRKLASIGVHARDWVTWHGFALNVATDLSYFDLIVPCGISAVEMTSITREMQRAAGADAPTDARDERLERRTRDQVVSAFADVFTLEAETIDVSELEAMCSVPAAQA
ncbi:MAG TPA: lipoyl(octanoyl) transferase LipB [Gemmatimonadaceae bacterium]